MRVRRPQAECAFAVLPAAQHLDQIIQRFVILRLHVAELRAIAEDQRGHAHAHQLLGAGIFEPAQVGREPVRQAERHMRNARLQFAIVRIQIARYRCIGTAIANGARREQRDIRLCRTHADTRAEFRALVHAGGAEVQRAGAEFIFHAHLEAGHAFAQFADFDGVARGADDFQMRRRCHRHRDLRLRTGTGDVVRHTDADIELIARRYRQRRIRRKHEIATGKCFFLEHADGIFVHRHRHDAQRAVEGFRHLPGNFTFLRATFDNARPVRHRLVGLAFERVEMFAQRTVAVTTGRGRRHEALELRQDQIEYLEGFDFQRALLEKEAQRIRRLVTRHLQDALIHREHHDTRRPVGRVLELDGVARFHQIGGFHRGFQFAAIEVDRKRLHTVGERARVNLVRPRIADERHCHIAVALEILGQGDLLRRSRGLGGEPGVRVDALTLDGNQPRTHIRRLDRQLDFLARAEILFAEFHLQLGVFLQRTREVGSTRHFVRHARQVLPRRVAHHVGVAARCVGRQRHARTCCGNGERFFFQLHALFTRFVFIGVVRLLGQHRHKLALKVNQLQILGIGFFRCGIDGDQLHTAFGAARHIIQIAVGFVTHEKRHIRHQRRGFRGNPAPAIGFKTLRDQMQTIRRLGKARQIQIELDLALVVGFAFGQRLGKTLLRVLRIVKLIVTVFRERWQRGLQGHRRGDTTRFRRCAEQVLQRHIGLQILRRDPALDRFPCEARAHFQAVRHKLLHLHRHRT